MEKPGYRTSEFWISLLVVVTSAVIASGAFGDDSLVMKIAGVVASVLASLGYTVSRSALKKAAKPELE